MGNQSFYDKIAATPITDQQALISRLEMQLSTLNDDDGMDLSDSSFVWRTLRGLQVKVPSSLLTHLEKVTTLKFAI